MSENNIRLTYLDNAATTPIDSRVAEIMHQYEDEAWGNPSSLHTFGIKAKEILDISRRQIAEALNAEADDIIFTSGGTEANNFALKGIAFANRDKGKHIIVSSIEHDSILNTCKWLEKQGIYVSYLPVDESGIVDLDLLQQLINKQTILVSIMHVNNEIGTIEPIEAIGKICADRGIYFHTDACQSFGKIPIDVSKQHISLMSLNAHKIHGPKGIGCLYVKKGTNITPLLHGGGQEFGLRATTENVPAIAAFAKATELCMNEMNATTQRLFALQQKVICFFEEHISGFYINGSEENRIPNNLNFSISGFEGETIRLLLLLDKQGIAVSAGSACSNNDSSKSASHVLQAIGRNPFQARGGIRISFGRFTLEEDIDYFLEQFKNAFTNLNAIYS
jgi:cysteine desulfurase